ncbi:hypothetical protein QYE76_004015 [Lolium multiflorum]|uniref:Expansin-like EG45 domain-containing protein n=1 Tax=Lolium multiflorum TaxID=4521 RepID=A0AAD8VZD4_LOLMU|nr:hypothetical protein QYE76_004015 [Lolium multiflorum]
MLLLFPFPGRGRAVAEQPEADESSLDTGVAGDVGPNFTESAASFGQSGVARPPGTARPTAPVPTTTAALGGFKNVNKYPFMAMTSAATSRCSRTARDAHAGYKIKCTKHKACSGRTETVVITDMNLLPCGALPLRPQRHRSSALAKPAATTSSGTPIIDISFTRVPCEFLGLKVGFHVRGLQRRLHGHPGGVRERRRRRRAGGPHGVRPPAAEVDEDARVLGIHLAPRLQPPPAGAILRPHPQRVRQDAGGPQRHPQRIGAPTHSHRSIVQYS